MKTQTLFPLILSAVAGIGIVMLTFDPDPGMAIIGSIVFAILLFPFFKKLFVLIPRDINKEQSSLPNNGN